MTARFVGTGITLGVILGVALGLFEASLPQPVTDAVEATDGWML